MRSVLFLAALFAWALPAQAQIAVVPSHEAGGTIANGNTFQAALGNNPSRHGCRIQNTSTHTLLVYFGAVASATSTNSFQVAAAGVINCETATAVLTDVVAVTTSTTSDTYVVNEY